MTRREVLVKAIEGRIRWIQAADILGLSPRQIRRLKGRFALWGQKGLEDWRRGRPMHKRIPERTVRELCRLKRELYPDFSVRHFHQFATEKHGLKISETWTRVVLQTAGLVDKCEGRGVYRRRRERRPMVGMLLHLDASTHEWLVGLPRRDLVVMLDDADGRVLFARFYEQEGTASTLEALMHVLVRYGRFCELYTDRGSHFCRTPEAGGGPDQAHIGQVSRVLKMLGIRQILARSPQARGRSERAFGTIQGRLPQELRAFGVQDYAAANAYLQKTFVPDFNRRFTVRPAEPESAFTPVSGLNLEMLLSIQHERVVRNDSTVVFEKLLLQLPPTKDRQHYVRCPVLVHEFVNGTLGLSYQGQLLARFNRQGSLLPAQPADRSSQRNAA